MTLSEHFTVPQQRISSLVPHAIDIPTQDRTEQPPTTPDPEDFDDFDESHVIRGYD
ncbi:hypothetical protein GCM10011581_30090 [Saccharopolyspora subtropica]|uniref:Uncharacterized protein n=1 Tax=Saccharopolyspora thermophila TaxID=89367 RepID=A0A917NDC0_9PSEU|nr:hypothetical protein [Saccharopolyspora subtropica]GGI91045.1 hypothetical protein GCM10011581_30090 [Saccharopolyspora subtropica]